MFPPYLTQLLQPLEVGCFQTYKHFHKLAVHQAVRNMQLVYDYSSFLQDLPSIREQTLTGKTIVSVWAKAGLYPLDSSVVLNRMKKYTDPEPEPELPGFSESLFQTPKTIRHSLDLGEALGKKVNPLLSSPTRRHTQSYRKGCEQILRAAHIQQSDLLMIQTATKGALRRKATNRNYIVGKGPIRAGNGLQEVAEKEARKPKKKVIVKVSDDEVDNVGTTYQTEHLEIVGWDFGKSDMTGVRDPFKEQEEIIKF
jgi:hypothetical protein